MGGQEQTEPLVLQQVGPRLAAADPRREVVTGWRHIPDGATPEWVTVHVPRAARP